MKYRPRLLVSIAVAALVAGACVSGTGPGTGADITVVATTTILGDVARNVVGTEGTVLVMIPIGADPHDFQPSAAQVASMNRADLVIANGLSLEEGLLDVLAGAAADGVEILEIGPELDPIAFGSDAPNQNDGSRDPHVWLDPLRMADAAKLIADRLEQIEPNSDWSLRADRYARELQMVDQAISAVLAAIPVSERRLVTNHDALGYFADRYGFEVIGTVIPAGSTLADPSSEELAELVNVMMTTGIGVIFGETTQPNLLAETVASELGQDVRVVKLHTGSLGEPGTDTDTLIGLLETNAALIAEALTG